MGFVGVLRVVSLLAAWLLVDFDSVGSLVVLLLDVLGVVDLTVVLGAIVLLLAASLAGLLVV
jgi:hypothetical protein